jgi:hypothetical protein
MIHDHLTIPSLVFCGASRERRRALGCRRALAFDLDRLALAVLKEYSAQFECQFATFFRFNFFVNYFFNY